MGSTSGSDSGKLKNTSWNNNGSNNEKVKWEYPYGYSWPSRQYTCSFCKREFKSAQALGGHMNVHRRDRAAMLRDHSPSPPPTFPPWTHAYKITPPPPPSNPNPNFLYNPRSPSGLTPLSSSSSLLSPAVTTSIYTHQYSLVSLSLSSCLSSSSLPCCGGVHNHSSMASIYGMKVGPSSSDFKEDEPVKVEMGLGIICRDSKDDDYGHGLDLELRLGNKKP